MKVMRSLSPLRQPARLAWCLLPALLSVAGVAHAASYALSADGNYVVRIDPTATITSAGFDASLITSAYAGWTVTKAGGVAGGAITVDSYDAGWRSATVGGGKINASYAQTNAVPTGSSLQWVQVITTNVPLNGAVSPYIDPVPNDDNLPFYWNNSPSDTTRAAATPRSFRFDDFSSRSSSTLATTNPINWNANLYQVEYDGNTHVTVRNGVSWGWSMKSATVGRSAGTFVNPNPTCPPATCSGIGTASVTWGTGDPGSLSFAATAFNPVVGDLFKIGTLTYHNGSTVAGTEISGVGLDIAMSFDNVSEINYVYRSALSINNTPNTTDPEASADYVAFTTGSFTNTFRVLEGATASADVMARLTPRLAVTPARTAAGDGSAPGSDKDPGVPIDPPTVIGYDVVLVGFANATAGGFVGPIPEPSTYALFAVGLSALGLARLRARRRDPS